MEQARDKSNESSVGVPNTQTFGVSPPSDESAALDTTATAQASGSTPTPFVPHIVHYETVRYVGEGGMGQVFLARDLRHKRDVAMKFLRFGADTPPPLVERFRRETEILKKLDHPNVVRVYDSGEWMGYPYYVMRYVPDGSLVRQVEVVRTSARRVVEFLAKVAAAVHYVHERGVFHRDLKPGNILVDEKGDPLLVDFGIARYDDGHTTTGVALLGTPAYMAPELIAVGPNASSERSDVWALGVILYELVTDERPFPGNRYEPELFERIRSQAPPPFATHPKTLVDADSRLEAICLKCLAKDPARRYQTAAELAADLNRWLTGEAPTEEITPEVRLAAGKSEPTTIAATTITVAEPEKWNRRRWQVAAGLLVMAGIVAAIAAPAIPWWKPKTEATGEVAKAVPPKKLTLAERLQKAGDEVVFIGETGLPIEPRDELPGFVGKTALVEKYCELSSTTVYLLELANEPLPFRYRIEADAGVSRSLGGARAGVYTNRGDQPQPNGLPVSIAYVNCFGPLKNPPPDQQWQGKALAQTAGARFAPNDPKRLFFSPILDKSEPVDSDGIDDKQPVEQRGGLQIHRDENTTPGPFHKLQIEVAPNSNAGQRGDFKFQPHNRRLLEGSLRGVFAGHNEVLTQPLFGNGTGVFVVSGNGRFRNARITRLPD